MRPSGHYSDCRLENYTQKIKRLALDAIEACHCWRGRNANYLDSRHRDSHQFTILCGETFRPFDFSPRHFASDASERTQQPVSLVLLRHSINFSDRFLFRGWFCASARNHDTLMPATERRRTVVVSAPIKFNQQSLVCLVAFHFTSCLVAYRHSCSKLWENNKFFGYILIPTPPTIIFCVLLFFSALFVWLYLQIFRSLESPAEDKRIIDLRENVIIQREQFLKKVTFLSNMRDLSTFNANVSSELEKYEFVSGSASWRFVCACSERVKGAHPHFVRQPPFTSYLCTTGSVRFHRRIARCVCTKILHFACMESTMSGWGWLKNL